MDFSEALKHLHENPKDGIQCCLWANHPTKRLIYRTGVDRVPMFGSILFHSGLQKWVGTWSVFMPTWREVYVEQWQVVPDAFRTLLQGSNLSIEQDEMERLINDRKE